MKWTVTPNQDPCSYPSKNHPRRGPGLSIISGHFITALHTGPNCYKQSRPFLSHPGVECEGQFDRLLTCPGLSHYHLRGLLKGSKSRPLVCYPFSTFCIMRGFIAHFLFLLVENNSSFPVWLWNWFFFFSFHHTGDVDVLIAGARFDQSSSEIRHTVEGFKLFLPWC